jgi:hypothetical protein
MLPPIHFRVFFETFFINFGRTQYEKFIRLPKFPTVDPITVEARQIREPTLERGSGGSVVSES